MTYPRGTRVLAWGLEEDPPRLLALCREAGIAVEDLQGLPVKRQREKAAERLLLCHAFGHPVTLSHDVQGAPRIDDEAVNLSITHTPRLVVVALNDKLVIGIDAEPMDRNQVVRVRDKFLNDSEKQFIAPNDLPAHIIAWTAKEAVIKAERNSALDWTDGIVVEPFALDRPMQAEITLTARCMSRRYRLVICPVAGHYLTVACQQ